MKMYQSHNLIGHSLLTPAVTITGPAVYSFGEPWKYASSNLITNLDNRGFYWDWLPFIGPDFERASHVSCYIPNCKEYPDDCPDGKLIVTYEFSEPAFIHAVLFTLDALYDTDMAANPPSIKTFEIYIGNIGNSLGTTWGDVILN